MSKQVKVSVDTLQTIAHILEAAANAVEKERATGKPGTVMMTDVVIALRGTAASVEELKGLS